jgi:hypothetical protein
MTPIMTTLSIGIKYHYSESLLFIVVLSVFMLCFVLTSINILSAVKLIVIMLSVVLPNVVEPADKHQKDWSCWSFLQKGKSCVLSFENLKTFYPINSKLGSIS